VDGEYHCEVDLRFGELLTAQLFVILVRMRGWVLLALCDLAVLYLVARMLTGAATLRESLPAFAALVLTPVLVLAAVVFATKRAYDRTSAQQLPFHYDFDADGVSWTARGSSAVVSRDRIVGSKVVRGLLLLFPEGGGALAIPARCAGGDFERLLAFVGSRVGRPG